MWDPLSKHFYCFIYFFHMHRILRQKRYIADIFLKSHIRTQNFFKKNKQNIHYISRVCGMCSYTYWSARSHSSVKQDTNSVISNILVYGSDCSGRCHSRRYLGLLGRWEQAPECLHPLPREGQKGHHLWCSRRLHSYLQVSTTFSCHQLSNMKRRTEIEIREEIAWWVS